jgi:hypothetical protein
MFGRLLRYFMSMAAIAAFAGLFLFFFGNSIDISCIRNVGEAPTCRITNVLLGRVPISTRNVADVVDVRLDGSCDDSCTYRAVLITANGRQAPVNEVYTDQDIAARQLGAIQGFLGGSAHEFQYTEPVQLWVVLMVGGFGLAGALGVAVEFLLKSRRG